MRYLQIKTGKLNLRNMNKQINILWTLAILAHKKKSKLKNIFIFAAVVENRKNLTSKTKADIVLSPLRGKFLEL